MTTVSKLLIFAMFLTCLYGANLLRRNRLIKELGLNHVWRTCLAWSPLRTIFNVKWGRLWYWLLLFHMIYITDSSFANTWLHYRQFPFFACHMVFFHQILKINIKWIFLILLMIWYIKKPFLLILKKLRGSI